MNDQVIEQSHRVTLWEAMLDAEMNVLYWDFLCRRFTNWDRWLKFIIALTSSGTAIAAWSLWAQHPATWKIVTGASCVISVYHSFFFHSERITKVSSLVATWKEVKIKYQLLWEENPALDSKEAWDSFESTKLREAQIDESVVPKDEKLLQMVYQQVLTARGLK